MEKIEEIFLLKNLSGSTAPGNLKYETGEADDDKISTGSVVSAGFILVFIVVSLLSNITICWLFAVNKKIRVRGYYYILSLSVSDILIAVFSMPPMVSYQLTKLHFLNVEHRKRVLLFIDVIDIISSISSVTNLTCISLDRLFGTLMPLKHRVTMTRKKILFVICLSWAYSITLALIKLIPQFYHYIVFVFTLGFALPLFLIILSYTLIFIVATKKTKRMRTVNKDSVMLRTILVVVIVFAVCWSPFFIISLLYQYCFECTFFYEDNFETIVLIMRLLTYFNSCCNPFIYGYLNIDFRNAFTTSKQKLKKQTSINSFTAAHDIDTKRLLSFLRAERGQQQQRRASTKTAETRVVVNNDNDITSECQFENKLLLPNEIENVGDDDFGRNWDQIVSDVSLNVDRKDLAETDI